MLMPKRVKYRKQFRGRMRGKASRGNTVQFGEYGLQAMEPAWITSRQIEASRRAIMRYIKRRGRVWIRVFPDKPVTKRSAESRMGKGKGSVDHYVAVVRPGWCCSRWPVSMKRPRAKRCAWPLSSPDPGEGH